MANIETFDVISEADGLKLSVAAIKPVEPIGVVQLAHGMAENKERYYDLMQYLAENGYVVIINDHRGHGKSIKNDEDLGYFYANGDKSVVSDVHQISKLIKSEYPDLPFYLLGHSMGSLIVRAYAKLYDGELDGLIISGCPSYNPATKAGVVLVKFLTALKGEHYRSSICNNLFSASFNKNFKDEGSEFAWISANKENVEQYEKSPLCGFVFTLNGYMSLLGLMLDVYSKEGWLMKNTQLPVWFISGADDPCMIDLPKFLAAVNLMQNVGYSNVTYKLYDGMRHEIFNETDKKKVYEDVLAKLNSWRESK